MICNNRLFLGIINVRLPRYEAVPAVHAKLGCQRLSPEVLEPIGDSIGRISISISGVHRVDNDLQ